MSDILPYPVIVLSLHFYVFFCDNRAKDDFSFLFSLVQNITSDLTQTFHGNYFFNKDYVFSK